MSGFDSVGGCKVVILTCVDNHSGESIDNTRPILVNHGTLHIDVAEQDTVKGVIQHDIEALEGAHDSDFGHTKARAVVAEADIAAEFFAHLVQCFTHDAEVLLRREGTAKPFCCSTIRHIVKQALSRVADNSDDVSTLACTCLSLNDILVDVSGSHDDIKVRLRTFAYGVQIMVTAVMAGADTVNILIDNRLECLCNTFTVPCDDLSDVKLILCHLLCYLLRS